MNPEDISFAVRALGALLGALFAALMVYAWNRIRNGRSETSIFDRPQFDATKPMAGENDGYGRLSDFHRWGNQLPITEEEIQDALRRFRSDPVVALPSDQSVSVTPHAGQLKTWTEYFQAQWEGLKGFELRVEDDKRFEVGQVWLLREYQPDYTNIDASTGESSWTPTGTYSGRCMYVKIKYVMRGGCFGLKPGWAIFGYDVVAKFKERPPDLPTFPVESAY